MQQPSPPMMPVMSSFPPANITTDQIQKCLDENKKLVLAILDNQNLGKLTECAQYQAQLQKNLMYLAAIADAQPQLATVPARMPPHPAMQQGGPDYMQRQAAAMAQQQGVFPQRMPSQFATAFQVHEHQQHQHQQTIHGQVNFRPSGLSNSMPPMQTEGTVGGATSASGGPCTTQVTASDARGERENKQDGSVGDRHGGDEGDGK